MEALIINLLRLLCPYLKDMAKRTGNSVDDMIIKIICSLVEPKV